MSDDKENELGPLLVIENDPDEPGALRVYLSDLVSPEAMGQMLIDLGTDMKQRFNKKDPVPVMHKIKTQGDA